MCGAEMRRWRYKCRFDKTDRAVRSGLIARRCKPKRCPHICQYAGLFVMSRGTRQAGALREEKEMYDAYDDYPQGVANDHSVKLNAEVVVEWSNEAIIAAVIERVSGMIYEEVKPKAVEAIDKALGDLASKAMLEMFDSEVQLTDTWGKSKGKPTSVRSMLQRDAEEWLLDIVDSDGRTGRNGYGDRHERIHWLFQAALNGKKDHRGTTALQAMVTKAIKSVIGDVTKEVEGIVKAQAKKALGVK